MLTYQSIQSFVGEYYKKVILKQRMSLTSKHPFLILQIRVQ